MLGQLTPAERREETRLLLVERQVVDPDLDHPTTRAQSREGQSPVRAARDRDRDVARQVVDHHGQRVDRGGARQVMHVVEHQHHRAAGLVQRRGQPRNDVGQRGRPVDGGAIDDRHVQPERALDREADIGQEPDRVGIGPIAGHPCHRPALLCAPQGEGRGLAVAGRGDHRDETAVGAQQAPQQCLPWQHGRPQVRGGELRLHEGLADRRRPGMERRGQGVVLDDARRTVAHVGFPCLLFAQHPPLGHRPVASPLRGEATSRVARGQSLTPRRLGWSRTRTRVKSADRRIGSRYSQPRRRM